MNINIDIGEILTKSWKITWKFKVLWIFGILSSCVAGNQGNFNFNNGSSSSRGNGGDFPDFPRQFPNIQFEQAVRQFLDQYLWVIILAVVLLCVLWFVFYFLGMIGQIGLIKGAGKADAGAETLTFGELWTESLPYFWRMFGLTFLVGLPGFLMAILLLVALGVGLYAAFTGTMPQDSLIVMFIGVVGVFVLVMCCLSLIMLVVGLIIEQSFNAIVLEDRGLIESLGRGWEVFSKNWLTVIVVGLIQWVVRLVVGIAEVILFLILLIPLFAVLIMGFAGTNSFATSTPSNAMIAALVLTVCCSMAVLIPLSLLFNGVLLTYLQTMWTLAYRRMTNLMKPALPPQVEIIEPQ